MQKDLIGDLPRGRKLVVQILETRGPDQEQHFVDRLDAWELMSQTGFDLPPVMIYGDAASHIVTEKAIAHLH